MMRLSTMAVPVMVGLVPTIHVFATGRPGEDVDARREGEHDGETPVVMAGQVKQDQRK
jgi:hypothetical protein